ncbi:MAG: MFS transporter [Candidatus Goldbacteria bacterium]|nr:MFS transporter [Candidatus Goldiibacteriota bacterium]
MINENTPHEYDSETKNAALISAMIAAFSMSFMGSSLNVALPSIGKEFGVSALFLGWIATSYLLSSAIFQVPFGRLADIYGRRRYFTAGMIIFTLSSLATVFVTNVVLFITLRVVQGIGGSMVFGTGVAILTSVFHAKERGKALGLNVAAVYTGLSAGPFLGGILTQNLGWRFIFLVNTLMCAAAVFFAAFKMKGEWAESGGESFDLIGSLIFAPGMFFLIFGLSSLPSKTGAAALILGILLLVLFVIVEFKIKHPVMNMKLFFHNAVFAFSNLAALIHYASSFAVSFLLSLYLQYVKGFSPQAAGLVLMIQPVIMMTFAPAAGKLSDRFNPGKIASSGMAMTAAGLLMLVFINAQTPVYYTAAALIFIGFGFAFFSSPNTNAVMSSVERKDYSIASAALGTMRVTGQMTGLAIGMMALSIFIGTAKIEPSNMGEFIKAVQAAFMLSAALCIAGIFASLQRNKK